MLAFLLAALHGWAIMGLLTAGIVGLYVFGDWMTMEAVREIAPGRKWQFILLALIYTAVFWPEFWIVMLRED